MFSVEIEKTTIFAQAMHMGKHRLTGEAFIEHPKAVMKILEMFNVPESFLQVALLHDVIEESIVSKELLFLWFGPFVSECVFYLTKEDGKTYEDRIEQYMGKLEKGVCFNECVYLVKLADVYHNLQTFSIFPEEKREKQFNEVYYYYIPFFHENFFRLSYQNRVVARLLVKKITSTCLNKRESCCHILSTEL